MDTIKVGDRVRSYDFDHRQDCYVEGVVQGFTTLEGCERYDILVDKDVWPRDDEPDTTLLKSADRVGTHVYPPVNGTPSMFGVCNYVHKLS